MAIPLAAVLCCLVSGSVRTATGAPISGAQVVLRGASTARATSDAQGSFAIRIAPGTYVLDGSDSGFASVSVSPVRVDHDTSVAVVLEAANAPEIRTIGSVTVDGRFTRVRGAVPAIDLSRGDLDRLGFDRVADGLLTIPSLDVQYPHNASGGGPATVSLRGPDPSETMLTLDGQLLNDGNTGDIDISHLPVAAFSTVSVSEGLGPQDLAGSSTIGGAVTLVSLRPTLLPHAAASYSVGSFGRTEAWVNATGSRGKLGYAFALDDQQQAGSVNETATVCAFDGTTCAPQRLGSASAQRSALANVRYAFSQNADIALRVFSLGDVRDQSAAIAGIDRATRLLEGPGPQTFSQAIRAYALSTRTALGAGELVVAATRSDDTVDLAGSGIGNALYDLAHRDMRTDESARWGRSFERSSFSVGTAFRQETFVAPGVVPSIGQNVVSSFVRGDVRVGERLRLGAGVFSANYTSFGSSLDGRFSAVYDADPATTVRFSLGTGFRAPLLIERFVFPLDQLAPADNNCVQVGQGNAGERPEHATEYELGASHEFATTSTLDASFYRTILRDPIENFYPLNAANPGCATTATSFPINVGNAVYEGAEIRFTQRIPRAHAAIVAQYGLNAAYPRNMPLSVANPTSGTFIVNNQQFANIPQQQASLQADVAVHGFHAAAAGVFRGANNPLHQPPTAFLDAAIGHALGHDLDLTLAGTNLTNAAVGKYQIFNGGQPYNGQTATGLGPVPTNLLTVPGAAIRVILTARH